MSRKTSAVSGGDIGNVDQYNFLRDEARASASLLASGTSTLKLYIHDAVVYFEDGKIDFTGGLTPVMSAPAASSRIDVVSMASSSEIVVTSGVEADAPSAPNVPANNMPICEVYNVAGQVEITDEDEEAGEGYIYKDLRNFLHTNRGYDNVATRVYKNTLQSIPNEEARFVIFENESYDEGSDFDNQVVSGIADATEANKLHDADGGFTEDLVGAIIWNTTDNTTAKVTAFVDSGELTIDSNIMVDGESYKIFFSKFTVPEDGIYLVHTSVKWANTVDQSIHTIYTYKNDATSLSVSTVHSSGTAALIQDTLSIVKLDTDDYIQVRAYQDTGVAKSIESGEAQTFLEIIRIA